MLQYATIIATLGINFKGGMTMKKRICACLLATVMTAILSISSFATPIDMGTRMSLSSTVQEKKGIKGKSLTAKQLEELKKEESTLFDYPEVSTSYIDKKKMVLELDVVGQASAGLKKKLQGIQNKYGVDSKITIVEEYEWVDLPLAEEPTEPSAQDPEQIKKTGRTEKVVSRVDRRTTLICPLSHTGGRI